MPSHVLQRQFLADTKAEVKQQLLEAGVFSLGRVSMQPRQRSWAFDQCPEIPHGRQWVLKVKVPAASLPAQLMDMAGELFCWGWPCGCRCRCRMRTCAWSDQLKM